MSPPHFDHGSLDSRRHHHDRAEACVRLYPRFPPIAVSSAPQRPVHGPQGLGCRCHWTGQAIDVQDGQYLPRPAVAAMGGRRAICLARPTAPSFGDEVVGHGRIRRQRRSQQFLLACPGRMSKYTVGPGRNLVPEASATGDVAVVTARGEVNFHGDVRIPNLRKDGRVGVWAE